MWDRDYEILTELIVETARVEPTIGDYGYKKVILAENKSNYAVTLQSTPNSLFIFKSDEFPAPKAIFNDKKNECKRADYILLCAVEE